MTTLTGGEAVVQALINHGTKILFGLPGIQNDWLYNALYDARDKIRVIHPRHEQGAGYMALGAALATGEAAVFNIVPGPGLLNAAAALVNAYSLSAPVLCLTGQIPSAQIGKGLGALHEIPDQLGVLRRLTKWAERVNSPSEAPTLVGEAFRQMWSGRPRPAGLEVPMDVLAQKTAVDNVPIRPAPFRPPLDMDKIESAARVLGQAKQPIIYVGSGAQNVSQEITLLAEMLQAPVVAYRTGHGVMDGRHYLSLQMTPSHELWKTADAVMLVGTHARIPLQHWGVDSEMSLIKVDVDPTAHAIYGRPDIAITARAEDMLPVLVERTAAHNKARASREEELLSIKADWERRTAYLEPQRSYLRVIRQELGEDGIFVEEMTQVGFASRLIMPVYRPRSFISTGYMGTLGFGFPTALGVKVTMPDKPVLAIAGDGGFMFTVQELATAVQQRIGVVTLIFNNNQYGNVQQMQKNLYGNRVIATDLVNPDFVKLAESFGALGFRAETTDQLRSAIRKGFASELPTLIEVPVGDMPSTDRFRSLPRVRG